MRSRCLRDVRKDRQRTEREQRSDVGATLGGVNEACSAGKSVGLIAKDLCSYARDLLVLKTVPSDGGVLGSADEIEKCGSKRKITRRIFS